MKIIKSLKKRKLNCNLSKLWCTAVFLTAIFVFFVIKSAIYSYNLHTDLINSINTIEPFKIEIEHTTKVLEVPLDSVNRQQVFYDLNAVLEEQIAKNENEIKSFIEEQSNHLSEKAEYVLKEKEVALNSHFALWVSLLAGVATILAVGLTASQVYLNREQSRLLSRNVESATRKAHMLKFSQLLFTLNALRDFPHRDLSPEEEYDIVNPLISDAIKRYNEYLYLNYKDNEGRNIDEYRLPLIMVAQEVRLFICTYQNLLRNPYNLVRSDNLKKELLDIIQTLIQYDKTPEQQFNLSKCKDRSERVLSIITIFKNILDSELNLDKSK